MLGYDSEPVPNKTGAMIPNSRRLYNISFLDLLLICHVLMSFHLGGVVGGGGVQIWCVNTVTVHSILYRPVSKQSWNWVYHYVCWSIVADVMDELAAFILVVVREEALNFSRMPVTIQLCPTAKGVMS